MNCELCKLNGELSQSQSINGYHCQTHFPSVCTKYHNVYPHLSPAHGFPRNVFFLFLLSLLLLFLLSLSPLCRYAIIICALLTSKMVVLQSQRHLHAA